MALPLPTLADYFDVAPVSLWLEDYSALKLQFEEWRAQGMTDLAGYLRAHPEWTQRCWDKVQVLRVNPQTLTLFEASSAEELVSNLDTVLYTGGPSEATYQLVELWNLAPGQRDIHVQTTNHTLKGRRVDARIHTTLLQGYEDSWARVISTLEDVSERRASEEQFRQITMQLPGMVYRVRIALNGERQYLFVSDGVRELYGVAPEAVLADGNLLPSFRHPEDRGPSDIELRIISRQSQPLTSEFRIVLADGTLKWVQITSTTLAVDELGAVRAGFMLDITARKLAEAALRESEERWKLALDSTGDGVWDWHIETGEEFYSKRHQEMFGYDENEILARFDEFDKLIHPDDIPQLIQDRQNHFDGLTTTYSNEHRVRCKGGLWKWVLSRGMVISRDAQGRPLRMIGTHTDISDRKRSEALIWQQANFDVLTGLPNRRMLRDRLEQEIRKGRRDGTQLALLFIDLDHFKEVNDTLGHDRGDQLLVQAARRIRDCLRETDTVSRMGGDEFTVLVSELADTGNLERILQNLLQSLAASFQLGDEQVFVSASVGITMYPQDGTEVEQLFKNADQALYAAKGAGRNRFRFYTPVLQEAAQHRVRLSNDLRSALAMGQFQVYYQPIVTLADHSVRKAEALLRWQHPVRGFVSPAEFIPIAESTGLIVEIGEWVFQQVAQQLKKLRETFDPTFQISINRSPVQFHSITVETQPWSAQLRAMGLSGDCLAVEITEGLLLDASATVTEQLLEMSDHGIQVSLDDFGTGYSSLSYLQRYDIDFIKIDQAFVRHLIPASTDLALCKAIIVMAHELGMKVVAEGVEAAAQHQLLLAAGCDYGQGYFFARPMPAAALEQFLADRGLSGLPH